MSPGPVRLALVMDHPAQQFARAFQLLAAEPGIRLDVYYWSAAERFYDAGFKRSISWDTDLLSGYPGPPRQPAGLSRAGCAGWLASCADPGLTWWSAMDGRRRSRELRYATARSPARGCSFTATRHGSTQAGGAIVF